jgi:hypothetical protein
MLNKIWIPIRWTFCCWDVDMNWGRKKLHTRCQEFFFVLFFLVCLQYLVYDVMNY